MKTIRDPVQGDIVLTEEEIELLDTFEMQRLRKVKQLGLKYLVYPGATHTRFEHSVGTRGLMERILHYSKIELPWERRRILYLSCLLHDTAHLCFSHPMEEIPGVPSHEKVRETILNGKTRDEVDEHRVLGSKEIGNTKFVADVLSPETCEEILSLFKHETLDLSGFLSNYLDVDTLDYILRDAYHLGIPSVAYDQRLESSFKIGVGEGGSPVVVFADNRSVLESIEDALYGRWYLYKVAYLHHTVMIAETMLRDAVIQWLNGKNADLLYLLGDEELLMRMATGESERCREMVHRLGTRRLYKMAYLLNNRSSRRSKRSVDEIRRVSGYLGEFLGRFGELDVLVTFPRLDPFKEFGKILIGEISPRPIMDMMLDEIRTLEAKYQDLWCFIVSVSDSDYETRRFVYDKCRKEFQEDGAYTPSPPSAPVTGPSYLMELRKALLRISREKSASLRILHILGKGREMTTDQIAAEAGLGRSTVSQYLNYLRRVFSLHRIPVLTIRTKLRMKYWEIENPDTREFIMEEMRYAGVG